MRKQKKNRNPVGGNDLFGCCYLRCRGIFSTLFYNGNRASLADGICLCRSDRLACQTEYAGMRQSVMSHHTLVTLVAVSALTLLFIWQPAPIKAILGLSNNVGAALDRFDMKEDGMVYRYSPAENYKLKLEVRAGKSYDPKSPPEIAIWLENRSFYHIKTLLAGSPKKQLPYWSWKVKEYEKAKKEALKKGIKIEEVDAVSSATTNASFDPRDYILPERNTEPFYLMIEVNQPNDLNKHYKDQPSIIYQVKINNKYPQAFQVLDIVGYSKYDAKAKEWAAYYPDGKLTSSLQLIDSALLTISR